MATTIGLRDTPAPEIVSLPRPSDKAAAGHADIYRPDHGVPDAGLIPFTPIRSNDPSLIELFAGSSRPIPSARVVMGGAGGDLMSKSAGRTGVAYLVDTGVLVPGRNTLLPVDRNPIPRQTYLTTFQNGAANTVPLSDATMQKFDAVVDPGLDHTLAVNITRAADVREHLKPLLDNQNALIHAALPPGIFSPILTALKDSGVCGGEAGPFRRILLEKPFGTDYQSARELGEQVHRDFAPGQVLLVDHFLAYPGMLNLTSFREDPDIDAALNGKYVDKVDLKMLETSLSNDRPYFRETGSLRDMVQNHAMQLLGTLAMEVPKNAQGDALQRARTAVLQSVSIDPASVRRGQFDGFNDPATGAPQGAAPSTAETYVGFGFKVQTPRWDRVPFTLTQAKGVSEKRTGADIHLSKLPPNLARRLGVPEDTRAVFQVTIQPQPRIAIYLPEQKRTVDYAVDDRISPMPPYARLMSDALKGDTSLFVEPEAAITAWKLAETVSAECTRQGLDHMFHYVPGSNVDTIHTTS